MKEELEKKEQGLINKVQEIRQALDPTGGLICEIHKICVICDYENIPQKRDAC